MSLITLFADCSSNPSLLGCAQQVSGQQSRSLPHLIANFVKYFSWIIAAVAVIMLIIAGLRYVLSGGNPQATKAAKETIIYALIGLVVAAAAYFIVAFVIKSL